MTSETGSDALSLALDPNTPGDVLENLFKNTPRIHYAYPPQAVHRALVGNPNVPHAVWYSLAEHLPAEALENPGLAFFLVEDPSFFARAPINALRALGQRPDSPEAVVHALLGQRNQWRVPEILAAHPKTPPGELGSLFALGSESVLCALAKRADLSHEMAWRLAGAEQASARNLARKHPALTAEDRALIVRVEKFHTGAPADFSNVERDWLWAGGPWLQAAYLASPQTAAREVWARLTATPSRRHLEGAAQNPNLSAKDLARLGLLGLPQTSVGLDASRGWSRWYAGRGLARNPSAPLALLSFVLQCQDSTARVWLARRPGLPSEWAKRLLGDSADMVRVAVVQNATVPCSLFESLGRSWNEPERIALAARADLSPERAALLARDETLSVRLALARNRHAPSEVLRWLGEDPAPSVYQAAQQNESTPRDWSAERVALAESAELPEARLSPLLGRGFRSCLVLAEHPSAPHAMLFALSRDERWFARLALASSAKTPAGLLAGLAQDPSAAVRRGVALNPAAGAATLTTLSKDPDAEVCLGVAQNRAAPAEVLHGLASRKARGIAVALAENPSSSPLLLRRLLKDARETLASAAKNVYGEPTQLRASTARGVLRALARNPSTPWSVQAELGDDFVTERLQNPAVLALVWRGAEGYDALPVGAWRSVAQQASAPAPLVEWLCQHPDASVREAARRRYETGRKSPERLRSPQEEGDAFPRGV